MPARVSAADKAALLGLVDEAVAAGWSIARVAGVLELARVRIHRWLGRRAAGGLDDATPGGQPVHGLLDDEVAAILALFDEWGQTDGSYRKLAHRGSYLGRVWASPSTVWRVLTAHDKVLPARSRPAPTPKKPWPAWVELTPNRVWGYDVTHFPRAKRVVIAIIDLVSRKWIDHLLSVEETSTQVRLVFTAALQAEGLLSEALARTADGTVPIDVDDQARPILLAVSDNGPQMTSGSTREFMALHAIACHFGRPGTPTDQAPIESFFSHVKTDWPHLTTIRDPAVLETELARVRTDYNGMRLHAGIGYVTPDDEHAGRGDQIRRARRQGLAWARRRRIAYHRQQRQEPTP